MVRIEGDSVIRRPCGDGVRLRRRSAERAAYDPRMQRAEKTSTGRPGRARRSCRLGVAEADVRAR